MSTTADNDADKTKIAPTRIASPINTPLHNDAPTRVVAPSDQGETVVRTSLAETKVVSTPSSSLDETVALDATIPLDTTRLADAGSAKLQENSGPLLNNRFVIEKQLGSGGMGQVFRAKDLRRVELDDDEPFVALKVLKQSLKDNGVFTLALQRESKKAQRLAHPNIITVYDFDRDGDVAYLSMECLEGHSFDQVIAEKLLDMKQCLDVIDRMARGLAYAHQEGFVHADFKPQNVFLTSAGVVKILDFGIAQAFKQTSAQQELEISALTPNYASLEMLQGESPVPSDDIYALGCVAYQLLTGKHPYVSSDGKKLTAEEAYELDLDPPPLKGVPRRWAKTIEQSVALTRERRPVDGGRFLDKVKPLIARKQLLLLVASCFLVAVTFFGATVLKEQAIPPIDALPEHLSSVKQLTIDGDILLDEGDFDFSYRLYTQAWDEVAELTDNLSERKMAEKILTQRINRVTRSAIRLAQSDELSDYQKVQLAIALEYLMKDPRVKEQRQIKKTLEMIKE